MKRVFVLLLDSFGIGATDDAYLYGDEGADTFGHIAEYRSTQCRKLVIPQLTRYGLVRAAFNSTGKHITGMDYAAEVKGWYGYAAEKSKAKDTPSGHWEMMGVPVLQDWGYFAKTVPSFPEALINALIQKASLPGVLGNCHASGTDIIERLGEEHLRTKKPIVYTSADSVFQIAAHEDNFGLAALYQVCEIARELVNEYNIARVIARPFLGVKGNFYRTINRRDLSIPPPAPTLFDHILEAGGQVFGLGKTSDIFAGQGITQKIIADGNMAMFDATLAIAKKAPTQSLIFTNFVDFDSKYGHRRDIEGYALALEAFDKRLVELEKILEEGDLIIITADHGCDPSWKGSDHTREHIPVLAWGPTLLPRDLGKRQTFSDIGQTIARYFSVKTLRYGLSFL